MEVCDYSKTFYACFIGSLQKIMCALLVGLTITACIALQI